MDRVGCASNKKRKQQQWQQMVAMVMVAIEAVRKKLKSSQV
jgi:hypothetical protein